MAKIVQISLNRAEKKEYLQCLAQVLYFLSYLSRILQCTKKILITEGSKTPRVTLKLLNRSSPQMGKAVNKTTISQKVSKGVFLKKKPLEFAKSHVQDSVNMWKKVLGSEETRLNFLALAQSIMFGGNPMQLINLNTIPPVKHGGGGTM